MAEPSPAPGPRVLLVLATSTGGVGRHVVSLVRAVAAAGIPVAVAGPSATDDTFGFSRLGAVFLPVEISSSPRPVADTRAVRSLAKVLTDWRPTVVHAHGLRAGGVSVAAAGKARRTVNPGVIVTWHNAVLGDRPWRRLQTALEAIAARGADLTLGASEDLVERARSLGARQARFSAVAAAPLPPPTRDRETVRAELGAIGRPLLLAVGRLAPQKDYPSLLSAALTWNSLAPAPVLAIAGDGPLQEQMQSFIDHHDLPVRLLGARDDVADLLAAADVVVLPSLWEARSLVAQEALRAGVPLVATAVGGTPGLVGDAALLVPPGDPGALAGAVTRLLAEPALAASLAAAGVVQASVWPDEEAVQEELVKLYREWRVGSAPPIA